MAVREVLRMGNPTLLERSCEVKDFDTAELHSLVSDLFDTMEAENGAGLAAPQIGVLQRVVIFGVQENSRYPDADSVPETVLVNPEIEVLGDSVQGMWEGCLSVPGMRGYVERPSHIVYRGVNQFGEGIEREVQGFHAVVVQHECDHLDGILYPLRIQDMSLFGFEAELSVA
ncbi:MAG TPA: peptide deformylase [Gammaproteobacteria bacterium]|jgi:peptide deformylase|nr:peptide deformylase [Pseudomonadota bacterium]HAY46301.1 peptide deformylase [Gammaproteobacteria bacterium]